MAAAACTSRIPSSMANLRFDSASAKPTLRPDMWSEPGSESSKRLGSSGVPDPILLVESRASPRLDGRDAGRSTVKLISVLSSQPLLNLNHALRTAGFDFLYPRRHLAGEGEQRLRVRRILSLKHGRGATVAGFAN